MIKEEVNKYHEWKISSPGIRSLYCNGVQTIIHIIYHEATGALLLREGGQFRLSKPSLRELQTEGVKIAINRMEMGLELCWPEGQTHG